MEIDGTAPSALKQFYTLTDRLGEAELVVLNLVADRLLARHGALHATRDWEDFKVALTEAIDRLLDEAATLMRAGGHTHAGQ